MYKRIKFTITFIFILCLNSIDIQAQNNETKAQIKSIKENTYIGVQEGEEIKKDTSLRTIYSVYSYVGEVLEIKFYNSKDSLEAFTSYKYNDKNKMIESSYMSANGSLIIKWVIKYNTNGFISERLSYLPNGKFSSITKYKTDKKGNVLEQNEYDTKSKLTERYTYEYDSLSNEILRWEFFPLQNDKWQYHTRYDVYQNPIEEIWADEIGMILTTKTYTYTYDANNNWIKCVITEDDEPITIIEREIEYY